jgi:hypothetical protein
MSFQEYFVKERREDWKDSVIASNQYLKLGDSFWSGSLLKCERVRLFFNSETKEVGILPCSDEEKIGLMVQLVKGKSPVIRWAGFVKRFSLFFDSPRVCLVKNGTEVKEKMKVIVLTGSISKTEEKEAV